VVPDLDVMRERRIVNTREILRFEIEGLSVGLPSHKRVQSYDVRLEPLPRTTTRKLKRFAIEREQRERQRHERAADERPWAPQDLAWAADAHAARALDLIAAHAAPGTAVRPETNLELDLGLDSMERVELITRLEQTFGTRVAPDLLQTLFTVRELVEALRPAAGAGETAAAGGDVWSSLLDPPASSDQRFEALVAPRAAVAVGLFVIVRLGAAAARVLYRLEVRGRAHLPAQGPFIVSPNHQSYLDAFLLVSVLPLRAFRQLFFVGASEYFESPLRRRLARLINVIPVDPDSNLLLAMQTGAFGLRHRKVLALFPEGERSIDGAPKVFKKGAAILSAHVGAPIVPVAIDGLHDVWPRGRPFRWRSIVSRWSGSPIRLWFGAPLPPPALPGSLAPPADFERAYERTTNTLREAVVGMWNEMREDRPR
jgi:long-chain acyl-CoA synthetase